MSKLTGKEWQISNIINILDFLDVKINFLFTVLDDYMVVYFSIYENPLYFTSDLRQIRYTINPTY